MLEGACDDIRELGGGRYERFPLERMYRTARLARMYDGPDEVHRSTVARLILREYERGRGLDFGTR